MRNISDTEQNVSCDIVGTPKAGAIIEGHETHTRTGEVAIDLTQVPGIPNNLIETLTNSTIRVPVTQAVIYGWYDNEAASYTELLGDRTVSVAEEF